MKKKTILNVDLGDAISMQDVIALMTVVFILFFIIMVPLVNIDRVRTERAKIDVYWKNLAQWLQEHPVDSPLANGYLSAFDLEGKDISISEIQAEHLRYIEAVDKGGNLHIIAHHLDAHQFVSIFVQSKSGVVIYGSGGIKWSPVDQEWFTEHTSIDYGQKTESMQMEHTYRKWVRTGRGELQ